MAAAACSAPAEGAADGGAGTDAEATVGAGAGAETGAETGAQGDPGGEGGGEPSSSKDDDGNPGTADDAPEPVAVDADAIQFSLGGVQLLCWADADDGSDDSVFGCQGAAAWEATEGDSPASVLLFTLGDGDDAGNGDGGGNGGGGDGGGSGAGRDVKAIQANAPVTNWQIQGVRAGGSYRLGDAIIDLGDREKLTFTVPAGDSGGTASGWVSVDDYGWDE